MGEGFGDLFAGMFYMGSGDPTYEASVRRYCIGEWDADTYNPITSSTGSGCLRWINGRSEGNGADIGTYSGTPGEVHDTGRYWSAAMTCVFDGMGGDQAARNTLLRLVLDSQTRLVPTSAPTAFEDQVASMLVSDRNLYRYAHQALIRSCASARNIANLPQPADFPLPEPNPTPTPDPTPTPAPDPTPLPGPSPDTTAPETTITSAPASKTRQRNATFAFSSSEAGSTFQCALDKAAFAACDSPVSMKVSRGKHTLLVRAVDAAGNADQTPAAASWKVKGKRHRH
jgi:hypothetical protein